MARYDVYAQAVQGALLLDVQADLLDHLNTRVVVPLLPREAAPTPARQLNPVFTINGDEYILLPQFLAAIPASELRSPITTLLPHSDQIAAALDLLLTGV